MSSSDQPANAGKSTSDKPLVQAIGPPVEVPVYNCHVYLSPRGGDGKVAARCATLPEVQVRGDNERDALQKIVAAFKETVAGYREQNQAIPWSDPPQAAEPDEQQRLIAVHL